ncbi:MAG: hypothetical protein COV34_03445 [Candidatus Zambryskibacteria bacterium CG10_big_fil_rev_8_21_14_0_10_42_12]|uniref:DNA polymerase III delta N-terminal domain-containing protein n=1 Tax=Candidatus Zambryskibacteria bacterium CG10_big_fil_rev_8_21_14_0_10_42_12 TaxID=1975115 RepID=A0A2H0QSF6_9BACT|nr:MAG: hypothetical protein COV34_03445 [Candidatus Zambryskibacteria bacterium CG10_big_fil_rev_8_21_14_0_10_42_12]
MIYTFFGTDEQKTRAKAHTFIDALKKKRPDAPFFLVKSDGNSIVQLEELSQGAGLFYEKQIVFADHVFGEDGAKEYMKTLLPMMKNSDSVFVVLEGKLLAPEKKLFEKYSLEVKEFEVVEKKKTEFNVFALGDALISQDKIKLWSLYLEAIEEGKTPEEIQGTLMWQAKSMALAAKAKYAGETGLKPFVFSKAKNAGARYTKTEMEQLPWSLTEMLHASRLEGEDLSVAMERWVLSL